MQQFSVKHKRAHAYPNVWNPDLKHMKLNILNSFYIDQNKPQAETISKHVHACMRSQV